jgi:hypothetical protein
VLFTGVTNPASNMSLIDIAPAPPLTSPSAAGYTGQGAIMNRAQSIFFDDDIISLPTTACNNIENPEQPTFLNERVMSRSNRPGAIKRSRPTWGVGKGMNMREILQNQGASAAVLFTPTASDPGANDIWPEIRNPTKSPARYYVLGRDTDTSMDSVSSHPVLLEPLDRPRPTKLLKRMARCGIAPLASPGWPPGRLPTELYETITEYLNRDDIKSMRLVCREFDRHVSQVLFKTAVVPFNTEIYGMLGQNKSGDSHENHGPGSLLPYKLSWMNASDDDVYSGHGLDIFRGFGRHIRRFGMSFEADEYALANLPEKFPTEHQTSFWGNYDWPLVEYCRFKDVAVLESAADETPRMATAFSELFNVRELALSINSGLGWLNGPDRSIRARILETPRRVFGHSRKLPDRRVQAQRELWEYIESCYPEKREDLRVATIYKSKIPSALMESQSPILTKGQPEMPFLDHRLVHEAAFRPIAAGPRDNADMQPDHLVRGPGKQSPCILFTAQPDYSTTSVKTVSELNIIPADLSEAQKEWLLETGWAQRAFLTSYMLSIIDNHNTFQHVHTLNISRLSCCYIHMLDRQDFWDALPMLENVTLRAIADFRTVYKDDSGSVRTRMVDPSDGIGPFYNLLRNRLISHGTVNQLTIGWETGGEHAEGLFARNKVLLPAPLLPSASATTLDTIVLARDLLLFPRVRRLSIENCWMTPVALQQMVQFYDQLELKHLTLDSVSLAGVGAPAFGQQHNPLQLTALGIAAAMAYVAQGGGPQAPANAAGQAFNVQHNPLTQQQQFMQHQLQAMTMQMQWLQPQAAAQGQAQHPGQMQAQIQAHIQANQQQQLAHQAQNNIGNLMNQINAMAPAQNPQNPTPMSEIDPETVLRAPPQVGSWLYVLDIVSPGLNLSHFGSEYSQANPERKSSLDYISLRSCGYALLLNLPFGPREDDNFPAIRSHPAWEERHTALSGAMLSRGWPLLGQIVQDVNEIEVIALRAAWDLETGWEDSDAAQGPEFDGLLPGGTGRFSGSIRRVTSES